MYGSGPSHSGLGRSMRRSYFPQALTWVLLAVLIGLTIIKFHMPVPPVHAHLVVLNDHHF